jgi:hypothetical protein
MTAAGLAVRIGCSPAYNNLGALGLPALEADLEGFAQDLLNLLDPTGA